MNTKENNRNLADFTQTIFNQAKALVPENIRIDFTERFETCSEFLFPVLLFFYFAKKNIRKVKYAEPAKMHMCLPEMINGRKTYRLFLPEHNVWTVLTFGYELHGAISERSVCSLQVYENTPQLMHLMKKEEVNLLETRSMIAISGNQSVEALPGCGLTFQRMALHSDSDEHVKAMNFITELLYAFSMLRSTSKTYEAKRPIHDTGSSANYGDKEKEVEVTEEKH